MNTSSLKSFAPDVRRQLMDAVERKLDYVLTADTADLRAMGTQVSSLRRQADRERDALVDRVAYTWFNRLAALRFLDARGWHPFKARVLTPANADETQPEVLKLLRTGSLPEELQAHTDLARLNDLLDGRLPTAIAGADPQGEVYRHLILAACRFYHATMPFLFEELDDETELLLPDDLLTATSVAEGFRTEISDEDCSEVEILGWLYQFYISEKKDAVMARKKAVPSEDIPAVTQLFTPHWIVRYLVENSLGRLWLRSRPNSRLKEHMPYYVEDPEGQAPADSLTVATPEEIKLLDPACGSGHMLTYAFDLLVKIYEEEGHAPSEIPERILTHNLFGLEICPRAAQLASFALVCKAREQSRRAFRSPVQPQVMCLRDVVLTPDEVKGFTDATGTRFSQDELAQLHQFREHTETFGALIQPVLDREKLAALKAKISDQAPAGDLLVQNTHRKLRLVLDQAEMLSLRYQVVVANPPYVGGRGMNDQYKAFMVENYEAYKADLFAAFVSRTDTMALSRAYLGFMAPNVWMYLSSHTGLRSHIQNQTVFTLVELPLTGFADATVQLCAFVFSKLKLPKHVGIYIRLCEFRKPSDMAPKVLEALSSKECNWLYKASVDSFKKIPGNPFAYWLSENGVKIFETSKPLKFALQPKQGTSTGDDEKFVRFWHEIRFSHIGFDYETLDAARKSDSKYFPLDKGGAFRKWYGNNEKVLKFDDESYRELSNMGNRLPSRDLYFRRGLTWSKITSFRISVRFDDYGFIFSSVGLKGFPKDDDINVILGYMNSRLALMFTEVVSPTLSIVSGDIEKLPFRRPDSSTHARIDLGVSYLVRFAKADWDNFETSWDFRDLPLLRSGDWEVEPGQPGGSWKGRTLAESWASYAAYCTAAIRRMQELETENNRLWIDAYDLQDELTPEVPEDEITLARADGKKDMVAFLSYAVGCMMGRYSLDHPGLILANAGDTLENYLSKVGKPLDQIQFPPDEDAIIPLLDGEWFTDDVVARTREFLRVTFGDDTLEENLRFIEESLGKDLRKYFLTDFYKDHLQTYKKRPIYWLFQSPKKGFGALVYLHRYTKDTVNTLLNDYLRDYLKKLEARIEHLEHVQDTASTTREKNAARKEADKLRKTLKECREWERDILLPLAQQRLEIDLDDGVKANYPKFNGAVAKVTGLS